jgi:hypothetical protein
MPVTCDWFNPAKQQSTTIVLKLEYICTTKSKAVLVVNFEEIGGPLLRIDSCILL